MNPEDDPEARIRALERPLGERATELGTGAYNGYPPPPTYPIPGWSGGTPLPPPRPPGHNRLWLILAVIAVGLIALAGGVVVYSVSNVTSGRPISSAPSREAGAGGGTFGTTLPSLPGGTFAQPTPPAQAPESGAQLTVSGIGENKTLLCNESAVSISGVSNTVVITGHCSTVQISGVSNVVTIDSSDAINASGIQNRITFHSGEPKVDNSGSDNTVEQG
jgi:hypothetical protein